EAAKEAVKRLREENKKLDLTYDFNYGDVPENLSEEEKPVVEAREKITAIEAPQGEVTKLKLDTSLEPVQFNWENIITDEAFDNFMAKLTQAKNLAQVMSNAISSSFSVMASKLSESLGISNDILNAFVS